MSDVVHVEYLNEVHMKVTADPSVRQELSDYFSFKPAGYQFSPKYKSRMWDGVIRMYSPFKPVLYLGLLNHLKKFCEVREYDLRLPREFAERDMVEDDYGYQIAKLISCKFEPRDYQNQYIINAIADRRSLNLSPTSSGKSLIIYLLQQHYYQTERLRTLIIVPTISLVYQMEGDFKDYGCDSKYIHTIKAGAEKNTKCPIVISTWQSLQKLPKTWFDQFGVVLGDEAHSFQAKALTTIMEKLVDCRYRHGFTGTLKSEESKTNRLVLEGLFGNTRKFVSTKDLIDSGTVADFKVKGIVLSHSKEDKKKFRTALKTIKEPTRKYPAEREYLNNHYKRNIFIRNLLWSLKGQNNLVLFDLVEKHGKILEPMLRTEGRHLHFIHGGTKGEERERIRHLIENDPNKNHDILASYGVFSTGVNLRRLDNVIFASGSKSEIKVLQSVGRSLRKGNGSDKATLYDLADILGSDSNPNYTLKHFKKRIEMYNQEQFEIKIFNIDL
jgi:superfamily II DNA or RNA helicase